MPPAPRPGGGLLGISFFIPSTPFPPKARGRWGVAALESALFNPGWQENLRIGYGDLAWAEAGERFTEETFESCRRRGGWVIIHMMKDENVERAIAHPGVMIASDDIPFVDGRGHPRGAGTFARVLGHYSREKELPPLMEALAKMTILSARRLEGHFGSRLKNPATKNLPRFFIKKSAAAPG